MLIRIKRKKNGLSGQTAVQELFAGIHLTLFSVNSYKFIFVLVLFFYCVTRGSRYFFVNNTVNEYVNFNSQPQAFYRKQSFISDK